MVAATSSTSNATSASMNDNGGGVIGDVVAVSDESGSGACESGNFDAPVACGSWVIAVATSSATMASCAGLHRRPSYTCTPFPYRRHYAVRRKNGVMLPR
jgi:hypothetical protein